VVCYQSKACGRRALSEKQRAVISHLHKNAEEEQMGSLKMLPTFYRLCPPKIGRTDGANKLLLRMGGCRLLVPFIIDWMDTIIPVTKIAAMLLAHLIFN